MNFSRNQIANLIRDFMTQTPDPTGEEVDDFFSLFSDEYSTDLGGNERDIAIDLYNRAFMEGSLDGLGKARMTKWVPDDKVIEKFSGDNLIKRGNLLGFKDYKSGVTFHNYPEGHKSRNSFLRSLGYLPTAQSFWVTPDQKKRVKVNNQNGRLSFEKVRESTESLDKGASMKNSLTDKLLALVKGSATENQEVSGVTYKPSPEDMLIQIVGDEYESGHILYDNVEQLKDDLTDSFDLDFSKVDFNSLWTLYLKMHDMGPEGFYHEYGDKYHFSKDFKDAYGLDEAHEGDCKEDYEEALEAIERGGLDRLQSVFAQLLEKIGAIQLLDNINNAPDDFGSDYYDQVNFIKNTIDLSDTNEVLNELLSASETLLDDTQIELLADDLENSGEDSDLMEEPAEGEEFPEEDWEDEGNYDWSSDDSQEIEEENLEETLEENMEETSE